MPEKEEIKWDTLPVKEVYRKKSYTRPWFRRLTDLFKTKSD